MNADTQYEKPLLLLFSELSIEGINALLSKNSDIILRYKKETSKAIYPSPAESSFFWNIQFEGLELEMFWFNDCDEVLSYRQLFCNIGSESFQYGLAISLGNNVKGGRKNSAIMASFFRYIRRLIIFFNPVAIAWTVTKIISDSQYFADVIDHYEKGGAFPILPMIDFALDKTGLIRSDGLSYFAGQEICYDCRHLSEADSMKRVMRVVHDIAVNGAYSKSMQVDGLEDGERVYVTIDCNNSVAHVRSVFNDN